MYQELDKSLTVSSERKSVVLLPVGITRSTPDFIVQMTLAKSTVLSPSSCKATEFSVLVDCFAQPVDSWVSSNDLVLWVHHDHLVELVD